MSGTWEDRRPGRFRIGNLRNCLVQIRVGGCTLRTFACWSRSNAQVSRPEWFAAVRRVVLGIGLCCAYGAGWTQGVATGEIHGIVVDSDGNGLSRLGVTARNLDTGEEVRAEALHDGSFTLAPLAPGDYLLRFEGTGRGTTLSVTPGDALELKATVTGSGLRGGSGEWAGVQSG